MSTRHLLRLGEVCIVEAGEHVSSVHRSAAWPKHHARRSRTLSSRVFTPSSRRPVTHAVVAGEVRRRLRSDCDGSGAHTWCGRLESRQARRPHPSAIRRCRGARALISQVRIDRYSFGIPTRLPLRLLDKPASTVAPAGRVMSSPWRRSRPLPRGGSRSRVLAMGPA